MLNLVVGDAAARKHIGLQHNAFALEIDLHIAQSDSFTFDNKHLSGRYFFDLPVLGDVYKRQGQWNCHQHQ